MPPRYEANAPSPMLKNAYLKKKARTMGSKKQCQGNGNSMQKKCTLIFKGVHVDEYL
jgi:hypothetical protein